MTDTTEIKNETKGMEPDNSSTTPNIKIIKDSLAEFELTQGDISEIKKHIGSIIDAIAQNRSMLTRAAQYWGTLPLWQKIGAGLALTVPTLVLGIVFNVFTFYVACALTLATYITSSYILDNHNGHDEKITQQLKDGMVDLADALENVIQSLDTLRKDLSDEIEVFHKKNEELALQITQLCTQVELLSEQGIKLKNTEQELRTIQIELEKKAASLTETVEEQKELLQMNHEELDQVRQDMAQNQTELSKTISELDQVRKELSAEIAKVNNMAVSVQNAIREVSDQLIIDTTQREAFQTKLEEFIKNKEASFQIIAERIFQTERELSLVKDELDRNNKRNMELIERQEKQMDRIEQTAAQHHPMQYSQNQPQQELTKTLKKVGLYAHNQHPYTSPISDECKPCRTA